MNRRRRPRQLRHLEELAARPHFILQVAPYTLGELRPFSHSVTLLTLPTRTMVGYMIREARKEYEWHAR
ncbi:Scr1 family TA system antitoxin-like transcriptional regulator [Kitasatospora sp. NPDC089509]|uniref:Scr1 family TA system antitoxin-like transcriptional regulator n=1 Tax=Kitasatospora sp. NPDC089509 TaxID=3364079 RepID=UPI003805877E